MNARMNQKNNTYIINKEGDIIPGKTISRKRNETFSVLEYSNLGLYFSLPLLGGVALGVWFDKRFNTAPVGVLVGIFFGLVASLFSLVKLVKKYSCQR